jgi:hypothetical protein
MMMMDSLIAAGLRLAEALRAENEALAMLDLPRAAGLADDKILASDAFAAAFAAAAKLGARAEGPVRQTAQDLTARLEALGAENRRLLERAIGIQSRVIETIAGAALPKRTPIGYGALGQPRGATRQPPALAVARRA